MRKLNQVKEAFNDQLKMIFRLSQYYSGKKEKIQLIPQEGDICLKQVNQRYQLCIINKVFEDGRRVEIRFKLRGKVHIMITQSRELCLIRRRHGAETTEMLLQDLGPSDEDLVEDNDSINHHRQILNEVQVRMSTQTHDKPRSLWGKVVLLTALHVTAVSPYSVDHQQAIWPNSDLFTAHSSRTGLTWLGLLGAYSHQTNHSGSLPPFFSNPILYHRCHHVMEFKRKKDYLFFISEPEKRSLGLGVAPSLIGLKKGPYSRGPKLPKKGAQVQPPKLFSKSLIFAWSWTNSYLPTQINLEEE